MDKPKAPSSEIQKKAQGHVQDFFTHYYVLLQTYRLFWYQYFRATYIFETDRVGEGKSQVFFPLCYREVEKISTRLTTNNPSFVIDLNVPISPDNPSADMAASSEANQAAMNFYWKLGNNQAKLRTWAKGGLVYGVMFAMVDFEHKTHKTKTTEMGVNSKGEAVEKTYEKEELLIEYPTFIVPDILDVYFDPRVEFVDDMPCIIVNKDQVRKSELMNQPDIYFNLDQIAKLSPVEFAISQDSYKINKFNSEGIPTTQNGPDEGTVNVKDFYGYFSESGKPEDECLYHITVVNDLVVIRYEEIDFMPFEKFCPIEVPNQGVGKGIVEPIKKLQDAYNLTRNQRLENVSLIMNKMWFMKQGSGIDPRKLVSRAGNVIPVRDLDGIRAVEFQDLSQSSFSEANALNTEIQSVNGTIDTAQDASNNGFTNLATGQKIRWNEFNTRFKTIKQNLEEALARLGQKMLMMTSVRAQMNPLIKDPVTQKFYHLAKEAFNSFDDFYNVSVLADSTAFDSVENAREEALAKGQLNIAYKAQGVPINMMEAWKDIMQTFPGTDPSKYLENPVQQAGQPPVTQTQQGQPLPQSTIDQIQQQPDATQAMTNSMQVPNI